MIDQYGANPNTSRWNGEAGGVTNVCRSPGRAPARSGITAVVAGARSGAVAACLASSIACGPMLGSGIAIAAGLDSALAPEVLL